MWRYLSNKIHKSKSKSKKSKQLITISSPVPTNEIEQQIRRTQTDMEAFPGYLMGADIIYTSVSVTHEQQPNTPYHHVELYNSNHNINNHDSLYESTYDSDCGCSTDHSSSGG